MNDLCLGLRYRNLSLTRGKGHEEEVCRCLAMEFFLLSLRHRTLVWEWSLAVPVLFCRVCWHLVMQPYLFNTEIITRWIERKNVIYRWCTLNSLSNTKTCEGNGLTQLIFGGDGWPRTVPEWIGGGTPRGEFKVLGVEDRYLLLFYYNFTCCEYWDRAWAERGSTEPAGV